MKKLLIILLFAFLFCMMCSAGNAAKRSYEEYMSKEHSLQTISPVKYSNQWKSEPFVMSGGIILSDYQKKYPDASLVVGNAYQERIVDGKTQLVCVAEGNFGNYNSSGRYTYLSTGGTILQLDLITLKSAAIYSGDDSINELWVFEDIIYFRSSDCIYCYYVPDNRLELLYTSKTLSGFRPFSNYIFTIVEENAGYWEAVAASGVKEDELLKDREAFSKWLNEKYGFQTSPESKVFQQCDVQHILFTLGIGEHNAPWYNIKTKERYESDEEVEAVSSIAFAEEIDESLPKELLRQVPHGAYNMQQRITFENLPSSWAPNVNSILIKRLHELGHLKNDQPLDTSDLTNPALERVSVQTVKDVFDSLFGLGNFEKLRYKDAFVFNNQLSLLESEGVYVYHAFNGGGDAACELREEILSSNRSGNDIVVTVRYCLFGFYGGTKGELCSLMGDNSANSNLQYTPLAYVEREQIQDFRDGAYDIYSPIYTHTFKPNGDGTYYWYSTEMTEAPKQIPENMVHSYPEVSTDITTNTTTDTVSDVSDSDVVTDDPVTDSATLIPSKGEISDVPANQPGVGGADVGVVEESTSYTWIYVTVGAVVVIAAAVAVFLVLKKKA